MITWAVKDAAAYRTLGFPTIDTTARPLADIAEEVVAKLTCQN